MRTSAEMVARALRKQRERAGVRVKVRLPDSLAARARICAADVSETLGDWVNAACRQARKGVFDDVAIPQKTELATRAESECVTVRAPSGMTSSDIRDAIARGCQWAEARRIAYNPQPPKRYILERS